MEKAVARFGAVAATAAVGLSAAAAAFLVLHAQRRLSNDKALRLYWSLWSKGDTYWLVNVRVPASVLDQNGDTTSMRLPYDDEGLVDCHVKIKDGMIVDVSLKEPSNSSFISKTFRMIDCHCAVLFPCFTDCHTHLMKTQTVPRNRNHTGTISEALECEFADQPRWKTPPDDIARRMHFAVQCALHHGTRSIRTHLDGSVNQDPEVVDAVFRAFDEVRETYQDRLEVQGVANLYLQHWMEEDYAKNYADMASQHRNVVLGAFVGRNQTGTEPDPEFVESFDALFQHAARLKMDVDLHIDESSDPTCCALASLCVSLAKARQEGYQGRIVCGHCCALSLQDSKTQKKIAKDLAALDAYVVANPFTNLGLQDRKGGKAPHCVEHPIDVPRTPQWRGITLLQELRAAGVRVASASDNVRDHWYAFGDYDLLNVLKITTEMSHTDLTAGHWANLVTSTAGDAMGLPHHVGYGQVADLVLFPNARRISELFARPQTDRLVIRKGRVHTTTLPNFAALDDLVAVKSERSTNEDQVFTLSS